MSKREYEIAEGIVQPFDWYGFWLILIVVFLIGFWSASVIAITEII